MDALCSDVRDACRDIYGTCTENDCTCKGNHGAQRNIPFGGSAVDHSDTSYGAWNMRGSRMSEKTVYGQEAGSIRNYIVNCIAQSVNDKFIGCAFFY